MLSGKRAVRYELRVPVLYRTAGEERWTAGVTANVSPSGALIVGELPVSRGEPIAVVISLVSGQGCLIGCGRIARVPQVGAPDESSTFAVSVPHFSIEHESAALSRVDGLHQGC